MSILQASRSWGGPSAPMLAGPGSARLHSGLERTHLIPLRHDRRREPIESEHRCGCFACIGHEWPASFPCKAEQMSPTPTYTRNFDYWFRRSMSGFSSRLFSGWSALYYYGPQDYTRVGYAPVQPVAFSHAQHAGQLGLSCLYCHTGVEESPVAKIPPTQTCMNCHQTIKADSPKIAAGQGKLRERQADSVDAGASDARLRLLQPRGSCEAGRGMRELPRARSTRCRSWRTTRALSMGWCLDCHREPENHLRPAGRGDEPWLEAPEGRAQRDFGLYLKDEYKVQAPEQCAGCHR